MSESPRRVVRLPFDFGQIVYHRARTSKVTGMVTGFVVCQLGTRTLVKWGDDLGQGEYDFFELTTEYLPDFTAE